MKVIAPDFYKDFHCIGSACKHNCCIGWEITIDEDTADFYRVVPGAFGRRLRHDIKRDKEGASFRMNAAHRCPLLNRENLCDIILNLGEGALCQVCADHPRFRADFDTVTEMGLGMACEAAAKLLLTCKDPIALTVVEDDGDEKELTEREKSFFAERERLFRIAQDRSVTVAERVSRIAKETRLDEVDLSTENWIGFFEDLETIEPNCFEILSRVMHAACSGTLKQYWEEHSHFEVEGEQILVYFLYRYLSHAKDPLDYRARVGFSLISCRFLMCQWELEKPTDAPQPFEHVVELARRYSAEVEYSEENVERILEALKREIVDRDKLHAAPVAAL